MATGYGRNRTRDHGGVMVVIGFCFTSPPDALNRTYPEGGRGTADLRYNRPLPVGTRPPSGAPGTDPGHGQADTAPTSAAGPSRRDQGLSFPQPPPSSNAPGPLRGGAAGLHQPMCGENIRGRVLRHPTCLLHLNLIAKQPHSETINKIY